MNIKITCIEGYPFIIGNRLYKEKQYPELIGRTIMAIKETDTGDSLLLTLSDETPQFIPDYKSENKL